MGSIEEIPTNMKDNIGDVQGDEFEDLEVGICDTWLEDLHLQSIKKYWTNKRKTGA